MMMLEDILTMITYTTMLIVAYSISKTHIMNNLIIMEFTVISILMIMFTATTYMKMESYLMMYFIVMMICESMMGLSLMIATIRTHGNDYLKSMSIMKF